LSRSREYRLVMRERALGVALLITALLAALVFSGLNGRAVRGHPVEEHARAVPAVGNCLLTRYQRTGVSVGDGPQRPPAAELGPCSGPRYGDVIQVNRSQTPGSIYCGLAARGYLGAPRDDMNDPMTGGWSLLAGPGSTVMVGPDSRQLVAGQAWAACVLLPLNRVGTRTERFDGPQGGAWRRGSAGTTPFGICSDRIPGRLIPCADPHLYERIAVRVQVRKNAQAGCVQKVRRETGMSDPTAHGELTIQLSAYRFDSASDEPAPIGRAEADQNPDTSTVECVIRPTNDARRLRGSLLAVGDGPVPFA